MRTILIGICISISSIAFAQRECASAVYIDQQKSLDPSVAARISEIENFIQHQNSARTTGEGISNQIRIPVVVHVLYSKSGQNISDAQIKSQIDALNRDFQRNNADTANTPDRFKPFAAGMQIEFVLATADPKGRATTGIVRKSTNVRYWSMDDKIKFSSQGGDDAWDSHSYLNFWVGDLSTLLGYSGVAGGPAEKDGIVINYTAFGTINVNAPYDMGRTATHEVGHWLGLKHIWGDTYCGDDGVDDTPRQGNFTAGCPNGFRSSCSNGTMGDMYMNYMDFTNDACMNLFTQGQKQRMLAMFNTGGPRNGLLASKGLNEPWTAESPLPEGEPTQADFKFYPNPTTGDIVLNFDYNADWIGQTISIITINGTAISKFVVTSKTQKVNLSQLKPGMYFIQGENGGQKIREKFIKL
jgi:hypothetical protein